MRLLQRALTALRADSERSLGDSFFAVACPPFRPRATAAGSFDFTSSSLVRAAAYVNLRFVKGREAQEREGFSMACKLDLRDLIVAEANDQGVPPEIALAVATQESGLCHWGPGGGVLRGKAGEYGVMQLMPATASVLGVDPTDVNQNIHGGVKYLSQLYDRFGDWSLAVQHYNGNGPAAQSYSARVMAIARGFGFGLALSASRANAAGNNSSGTQPPLPVNVSMNVPISANTLVLGGIVAGAGLLAWSIAS